MYSLSIRGTPFARNSEALARNKVPPFNQDLKWDRDASERVSESQVRRLPHGTLKCKMLIPDPISQTTMTENHAPLKALFPCFPVARCRYCTHIQWLLGPWGACQATHSKLFAIASNIKRCECAKDHLPCPTCAAWVLGTISDRLSSASSWGSGSSSEIADASTGASLNWNIYHAACG